MRAKEFFRRAASLTLAVTLSLTSVLPAFAMEAETGMPTETEVGVETEVSIPEDTTEAKEEAAEVEATSQEDSLEAETDIVEEVDENNEVDDSDPYILLLPHMDGVSYSYDASHKDSELSADAYSVLLYEAGEQVEFSAESEYQFAIIDSASGEKWKSEDDIIDGKVSFSMPSTDLSVQFILPADEEEESEELPVEIDEEFESQEKSDEVEKQEAAEPAETEASTEEAEQIVQEAESEVVNNVAVNEEAVSEESDDEFDVEEDSEMQMTEVVSEIGTEAVDDEFEAIELETDAIEAVEETEMAETEEMVEEETYHIWLQSDNGAVLTIQDEKEAYYPGDVVTIVAEADDEHIITDIVTSDAISSVNEESEEDIDVIGTLIPIGNANEILGEDEIVEAKDSISFDIEIGNSDVMISAKAAIDPGTLKNRDAGPDASLAGTKWARSGASASPRTNVEVASFKINGAQKYALAYCIIPGNGYTPFGESLNGKELGVASFSNLTTAQQNLLIKALFYLYGGPGWNLTIKGTDGANHNMRSLLQSSASGLTVPATNPTSAQIQAGASGSMSMSQEQLHAYAASHYILGYIYCKATGLPDMYWNGAPGSYAHCLSDSAEYVIEACVDALRTMDMPEASFSTSSIKATYDSSNDVFKSGTVTYDTFDGNDATITLPANVKMVVGGTTYNPGATVTVKPGQSFYFIHTNPDAAKNTKQKFTFTAKYATDFSAYVIAMNAAATQDGGFSFISSTTLTVNVSWPNKEDEVGRVRIVKKSSNPSITNGNSYYSLKGASFRLDGISGNANGESYTLTTDANGNTQVLEVETGTYTVTETKAPTGFKKNTNISNITVTKSTSSSSFNTKEVPEEPITGKIIINKRDSEEGANVTYSKYSLAGAKFEIYDDDDAVVGTLTSKADGSTSALTLPLGKYTYKEVTPPTNYSLNSAVGSFTLNSDATITKTVNNTKIKGQVRIKKVGKRYGSTMPNSSYDLSGAKFDVFNEDNVKVATGLTTTKVSGEYVTDVVTLPFGTYTVKETTAPKGYKANTASISFTMTSSYTSTPLKVEVQDEEIDGYVEVLKEGVAFGTSLPNNGFYDLAGAEFKIYDASNAAVSTITTSKATRNGKTVYVTPKVKLPLGSYTLKETKAPKGYELNTTSYPFTITASHTETVPLSMTVKDTEKRGKIVIKKRLDDDEPDAIKQNFDLSQIRFKLTYLDDTTIDPIQNNPDTEGNLTIENLFLGSWKIEEIKTLDYHKAMDPVTVTVREDFDETVDITNIENKRYESWLILEKRDAETNELIKGIFSNTAFKILDMNKQPITLTYYKNESETVSSDTFVTNNEGYVRFAEKIYGGKYYLTEIDSPSGYKFSDDIEFEINSDRSEKDPVIITVKDAPLKKRVNVTKIDEETGKHCAAGFEFVIVTADDIVDGSGTVREGWAKDTVVDTIVTNEDGIAASNVDLYVGNYYIQETKVPETAGMAINSTKYPFSITDDKDDGMEETMVLPLEDIADKPTTLHVTKTDTVVGKSLAGITFRVKEKDTEDNDDQLHVTNDKGEFTVKYLCANKTYTVQEVKTLPGYNLNDEVYEFSVDENGLINESWKHDVNFVNTPNEVHISKRDITNEGELPGAHLVIKDENGEVYDEWDSTEEDHILYEMPSGRYTLTETISPENYELSETITFDVVDSKIAQTVVMHDSPYREVDLSKQDITNDKEIEGCTLTIYDEKNEVVETWVSGKEPHRVKLHSGTYTLVEERPADGYVTADSIKFTVIKTAADDYEVMGVTMKDEHTKLLVSKKDITNGEEIPGAHLIIKNEKDEIVAEWDSEEEPHYIEMLPIGKYTLTEITAPDGYEVAETISFTIKDDAEIQHVQMFDSPYRKVVVSKQDITGAKELVGAHLQITDKDGNVVEKWVSEETQHEVDLPSGVYFLTETKPADGYTTAETIQFTVARRETEGDIEVQHVEMFDKETTIEISKQDVTNSKELPGAKLQIKDESGKIIHEWTSTNEPHKISMLPIGKYTLTEITAPEGYEIAENVNFEVLDTAEIQHVVMYDKPKTPPTDRKVQTGDNLNPWAIGGIAGAIVVLLAVAFVLLKKKKDE